MTEVSTSSGLKLRDAEKLAPSDPSLDSQEKRQITGLKVSLVPGGHRRSNFLTALVAPVFGQHIDSHLCLLSRQYDCCQHRSSIHIPPSLNSITPAVTLPKRGSYTDETLSELLENCERFQCGRRFTMAVGGVRYR